MHLQRIELQGFKSFAQKTILEFPVPGKGCLTSPNVSDKKNSLPRAVCGVTAIVGPNGSGKSNIVDAVRWVLGEQSFKLLRGKKSTDVIFSGSSQKSRLNFAEVSLLLNNEDRIAPIDYSEIAISRRIYRDGSSEYLLNKKPVRLFDIVMLLAKANFGHNSYSVIGQGMVDRIVNYSPAERRNFFDEATGVKQFQIKRDKAAGKLERSRDNIARAQSLLQELKPRLNSLTRQVNRLNKRQTIKTELGGLQERYYGKLWLDLDREYQRLAKSFAAQEKEKIFFQEKITEIQKTLDEFGRQESRKKLFDRLQEEYRRQLNRKNEFTRRLAEVKGRLDVEYFKIGKQDFSWLKNQEEKLTGELAELGRRQESLDKEVAELQEEFSRREQESCRAAEKAEAVQNELFRLQKDFDDELGVSKKEIRQAVDRLYSLAKNFSGRLGAARDQTLLPKLKRDFQAIFSELDSFYRRISGAKKIEPAEERSELQKKLFQVLKEKDEFSARANQIKIKLEVAASEQKSRRTELAGLRANLEKIRVDLKKHRLEPRDQQKISYQLQEEREKLAREIAQTDEELAKIKRQLDDFNQQEENKKEEIFRLQQEIHQNQLSLNQAVSQLNAVKVELTKIETKKEGLFQEMKKEFGEKYRPRAVDLFEKENPAELEKKIIKLKRQLELIGGVDEAVQEEYQEVKERYDFLNSQSDDLEKAIKDLGKVIIELDKMIKERFEREFKKINKDFSRYFKKFFGGGSAKLTLVKKELTEAEAAVGDWSGNSGKEEADSEKGELVSVAEHPEAREERETLGIDIEASPAGKKIRNIAALSGGEKTMTALALICAVISNNPSPFILFDEVDAALDEANSVKFGDIIEELSRKSQFIMITHNQAIMARADILYGITMQQDGISRLLSLKLSEAEKIF